MHLHVYITICRVLELVLYILNLQSVNMYYFYKIFITVPLEKIAKPVLIDIMFYPIYNW